MVLKQTRAELEHQQAVFAKELQDLKETLQVRELVNLRSETLA